MKSRSLFREADDSGLGLLQRGGWSPTTARTSSFSGTTSGRSGDELLAPGKGTKSSREIIAGQPDSVEETEETEPDMKRMEDAYLARPKPNVLIYATDRNYLASVLERIADWCKDASHPGGSSGSGRVSICTRAGSGASVITIGSGPAESDLAVRTIEAGNLRSAV